MIHVTRGDRNAENKRNRGQKVQTKLENEKIKAKEINIAMRDKQWKKYGQER